jgi:lipopolysaccharide/colanic/teichoic acid biosynthesis glycosyltransferase
MTHDIPVVRNAPVATCSRQIGYCEQQCPVIPMPWWKRAIDIVAASVGLLVLAPLLAGLAVYIRLVSPGPVLFKQRRVGLGGKPFTCLKFRTMHIEAGVDVHQNYLRHLITGDGIMTKLDHGGDPRVIRGGSLMRHAGIDELPQLVNVLLGQMSLIGPRPCIPYEFEHYCHCKQQRVCVTPGLTGLWQVSGKNKTTYDEMVQLDLAYAMRMSPWQDLRILVRTLPVIVSQVRERNLQPLGSGARAKERVQDPAESSRQL